jgi:predicted ATPase
MDKPLSEESRPNVWVIWSDQDYLPTELESGVGLIIKLHQTSESSFPSQASVAPCTVAILSPRSRQISFRAKFALLEARDDGFTELHLSEPASARRWMTLAKFKSRYGQLALLIGDRKVYTEIFRLLPQAARRLLLLVNDLAALNALRPSSRILRQVRTSTKDLWSQFFREDEERFSLVDFRRTMRVLDLATTNLDLVESIAADVPLWGGHFVLPLRLSFPEVLGQRQLLNVVIGPNGSGKTNLLLGLARCVVNQDMQFSPRDTDAFELNDDGVPIFDEMDDLELADFDHGPARKQTRIAVFTYERTLWTSLRQRGVAVYEQGVRAGNWRQLTQLIYEVISSTEPDRDALRDLGLLKEILSGFLNTSEMKFPLHPAQPTGQRPQWMDLKFGSEISLDDLAALERLDLNDMVGRLDRGEAPLMRSVGGREYTLSSGERSLTLFCARLMIASRDSALVLIDEPENHLHPRFITLMVQTLARSLQATGSRALLVTHSPFVVREFERSTVKIMKKSADGVPQIFHPSLQTLGADVSMISDYVFEDEQIRKGFQESIDRAMRTQDLPRSLDKSQLERLAADLGEDAVSYLIERSESAADEGSNA